MIESTIEAVDKGIKIAGETAAVSEEQLAQVEMMVQMMSKFKL